MATGGGYGYKKKFKKKGYNKKRKISGISGGASNIGPMQNKKWKKNAKNQKFK